jgi:hypothetical protein
MPAGNNMFALWPGEWLNFSNFKLQRLVSWDNARLRKPATSQTQTLPTIGPARGQ